MPNITTIYSCSKCGAQFPKWQGSCTECGSWGTVGQENIKKSSQKDSPEVSAEKTISLKDIDSASNEIRIKTHISELDRVLGGGLVKGSLVLLGGDPGVGKSTIALQIANTIKNTLYISGEESANQVKLRADRLKINLDDLKFLNQTDVDKIIATIKETKPKTVIIDSIQTINFDELPGGLGSVSQITACTTKIMATAKETGIPVIIIGHVTKEGVVAGPKVLEHLVDTVLYLENDNKNFYKILRGVKNRFGSTGEIGVFEMTGLGLKEISNASRVFVAENQTPTPGTVTTIIMEGTRPFLVEIQALVAKTVFGYPIRKSTGFDLNRLQMLIAVISKIGKVNLENQDVYLNIAGGLKTKETAIDLAVIMAIVSAFLDKSINGETIVLGEVGLSGEIRPISQLEARINEAKKLGFKNIVAPHSKLNTDIVQVKDITQAVEAITKKL